MDNSRKKRKKYNPYFSQKLSTLGFRPETFLGNVIQSYKIIKILLLTKNYIVYYAESESFNKSSVIKIFQNSYIDNNKIKELLEQKAKIINLDNKNISKVISIGDYNGFYYRIEEFIPYSRPLSTITLNKTVGWHIIKNYLFSILNALLYLHKNNISHGNLDLSNILIENNGNIYLTNFAFDPNKNDNMKDIADLGKMYYNLLLGHPITENPTIPTNYHPTISKNVDEFIFSCIGNIDGYGKFNNITEVLKFADKNFFNIHDQTKRNISSTQKNKLKNEEYFKSNEKNFNNINAKKDKQSKKSKIIVSTSAEKETNKKRNDDIFGCGCLFFLVFLGIVILVKLVQIIF